MSRVVRLRPWQKAALDKFVAAGESGPDFLTVATPGAGKTTFALAAALRELKGQPGRRLIVVAPTAHLKLQWAQAATRFGLHLHPEWSAASGSLAMDMHGIVTTYQQVASSAAVFSKLTSGAMVILDEIHHAGDDRAWGDSVRQAFEPATRRLALSGTPFRSDTSSIPFVRYRLDEAESDYEYGYADALRDGRVVRPVYFPRINGFMEWVAPNGLVNSASFEDPLDRTASAQRLRTALSSEGDWLPAVIAQAHERLMELRATRQPNAGGLIIATDQEHARAIAELMRWRLRVNPTIVLSDDPQASSRITHFADGDQPWIVAVRMVSEGVDIPRLAIGVYATTTTTELFFRQAVGRLVRWTAGVPRQKAFLFIPDDPRLRQWAHQIADSRKHSLRKPADDDLDPMDGRYEIDPEALDKIPGDTMEQLSLFNALSSVVTDVEQSGVMVGGSVFDDGYESDHDGTDNVDSTDGDLSHLGDEYLLDVEQLAPPLPGGHVGMIDGLSRYERKEKLRLKNAQWARDLARLTGMNHGQINGRLNRDIGLVKVDDATVEQLERRIVAAEKWWKQLSGRP
jgi:superfamily II DNA or RNA helicase